MYVGYRMRDWRIVSYQPENGEVDVDADGTVPSLYFTAPGDEEERPPMENEIMFFPHFALENCGSKSKKERQRLQMQFMASAHAYLALEFDSIEALKEYEKTVEDLKWRRWQSWLDEHKKWKRRTVKDKISRRERKAKLVREMQQAGVPEEEIDRSLESDDSGCEMDGRELHMYPKRAKKRSSMGPPKRPNPNGNGNGGPAAKKRRPQAPHHPDDLMMSGARGEDSDNVRARSPNSMINGASREVSPDFDPNPPQAMSERDHSSEDLFVANNLSEGSVESDRERRERSGGFNETVEEDVGAGFVDTADFNGAGLSEQEAFDRQMRASQEPQIHRAMRASVQRGDQSEQHVTETTEDQNGISSTAGRRARKSAPSTGSRARSGSHGQSS